MLPKCPQMILKFMLHLTFPINMNSSDFLILRKELQEIIFKNQYYYKTSKFFSSSSDDSRFCPWTRAHIRGEITSHIQHLSYLEHYPQERTIPFLYGLLLPFLRRPSTWYRIAKKTVVLEAKIPYLTSESFSSYGQGIKTTNAHAIAM